MEWVCRDCIGRLDKEKCPMVNAKMKTFRTTNTRSSYGRNLSWKRWERGKYGDLAVFS